jgi:hypothetical protein
MKKLLASLAGLALSASVGVANAESSQPTTLSAAQLDGVTGASGGQKYRKCGGCDGGDRKNENSTRQTNQQLIGVNAINGNNVALVNTGNQRGGDSANQANFNSTRQGIF